MSPRSRWPAASRPATAFRAAETDTELRVAHRRAHPGPHARQHRTGYYDRKISEGKTHNEAMRCLKRRLADHVWRIMTADERDPRTAAGPGGQPAATLTSSAAGSTPITGSSDKSLPGPASEDPTTSDPAA